MTPVAAVWAYLVVSAVLAVWVLARFPDRRPKSIPAALGVFLVGQLVPNLGLVVLPSLLRLPNGLQLALPLVVLPAFLALWLTLGWLLWAIVGAAGGPRGGHPVRKGVARTRT
jgi:hypothetical protein